MFSAFEIYADTMISKPISQSRSNRFSWHLNTILLLYFLLNQENKDSAYSDQPLREGKIHISAPHIYCSALESLELEENSSTSFLNIGSGTGYLSCIVAEILGPKSLNYGKLSSDVL